MSGVMQFQYDSSENILYREEEGHYYIPIPAFYAKESHANDTITFMLDTGAYLTVITPYTAEWFGFNKLTPINPDIILRGYAGECKAALVEIPGLVIGGKILDGVKVAIPKMTEQSGINSVNILGLNVLEYFRYLIDSADCKMYFARNEDYKIPKELGCVNIRAVSTSI